MTKSTMKISLLLTLVLAGCSSDATLPDITRETDRYLTCADLTKQISENQRIAEAADRDDREKVEDLVPTALIVKSYNVSGAGSRAHKRVKHLTRIYENKKCDADVSSHNFPPRLTTTQVLYGETPLEKKQKRDAQIAAQRFAIPQQQPPVPQYIVQTNTAPQYVQPRPAVYNTQKQQNDSQLPPAQLPDDPANVRLYEPEPGPSSANGTTPGY